MNILLIGGTGVISTAVSNYCANLGYNVFIINRGKTKKNIGKNINIIRADIRKEVDGSEIYVNLQQNKLNAKSTSQEKNRLSISKVV